MTGLIAFDLDGCLVDSRVPITTAINHGLAEVGVPTRPVEDLVRFIGPPLLLTFEGLLAEAGRPREFAQAAVSAYRDVYAGLAATHTTVVPGVSGALTTLSESGRPLVIVTSKPAPFARPILDAVGLAPFFEDVFAPELSAPDEHKPETLARALTTRRADPAAAVMVGDRRHDVEAGRACGTRTVGVTWGIGTREELLRAGVDVVVDDPVDLVGSLAGSCGPSM